MISSFKETEDERSRLEYIIPVPSTAPEIKIDVVPSSDSFYFEMDQIEEILNECKPMSYDSLAADLETVQVKFNICLLPFHLLSFR